MHSIYTTQHFAGVGSAVIIICQGEQEHVRFAEYHILLTHTACKRISKRLLTEASTDVVTDDDLRDQALNFSIACLQNYVDEHMMKSGDTHQIVSSVAASRADDSAIRTLRYAGVCTQELEEITRVTLSAEIKALIRMLRALPVISVQEL
jgi:hypothetical protein